MRIVCTSDTHEQHAKLEVPDGDIFVFAGDFTMIGESKWVEDFNKWLGKLPHKYKVVIAGNHDRSFDLKALEGAPTHAMRYYGKDRLSNCTHYLLNDGCEKEGLKFWGSPYTPKFHSDYWKFHYIKGSGTGYECHEMWQQIPEDLDLLITHGPPDRILDQTLEGDYAGCTALALRLPQIKPRHHVFGHIHEGFGHREINGTHYYNISAVDRLYRLREKPCLELEL